MKRTLGFVLVFLISSCGAPATVPATPSTPLADDAPYAQSLVANSASDLAELPLATRYFLTLRFDPAELTLSGTERVRYFNRSAGALTEVYFRLFANLPDSGGKATILSSQVNGIPSEPRFEQNATAMRLPIAPALAPQAFADISLDFKIQVPRNNTQHYADFTADDAIVTLPTVYPLIPAYDAKGWHIETAPAYGDLVYADAAFYAITVTVPATMTVIASGSTLATQTNADGTIIWHIVGAPMRDFDLNLASRLQKNSAVVGETTIHSYYEPSDADAGKRALQIAVAAFKTYETRAGAYPYRELDVVQTPTTAGGIEYPGVATIGRELYRDARNRDFFEFAVAHEVAHQWFYGVVGNDQVNEPWVDESLVQYMTLLYYEDGKGSVAAQNILRDAFQGPYKNAKDAGRDQPVNLPVRAYSEQNYGEIVYGKGPLFFDAIRKKMGDALFFQFLKTYSARFRWKIATGDDVLKTAESVYGKSLRDEYQQWIAR